MTTPQIKEEKWEMGILSPAHLSDANWSMEESKNTKWTPAENKMFENALALYDKDTPDRWHKVAAFIPGKTVGDVIKQYRELEVDVNNIEAGLVPIPGYDSSTFTLDWVDGYSHDGFKHSYTFGGKRSSSGRHADQERKKGVPWTEEEHKLFLMGLKKYGKGDWRNISRNFVVTRTPTQVASHAQKYFIRQLSGGKDKRRASIHDITTVDPNEIRTPSPENMKQPSPDQSSVLSQQSDDVSIPGTHFQWNQSSNSPAAFNSTHGNMFMSSPYMMGSYGLKIQDHLQRGSLQECYMEPENLAFQMQSAPKYNRG